MVLARTAAGSEVERNVHTIQAGVRRVASPVWNKFAIRCIKTSTRKVPRFVWGGLWTPLPG